MPTRSFVRVFGMSGFVYTHAAETREWYLEEIRQRYGQTLEEYQHLLEETRVRRVERDLALERVLEIERKRLEEQEEQEEECTTDDDDDDDYDDDAVDEDVDDDDDDDFDSLGETDDESPSSVPPRRDAAADKLREASELLFEHKDCLPEGVYLKIFDALKCQWDGG